jgi:hypothetical protein
MKGKYLSQKVDKHIIRKIKSQESVVKRGFY